MAKGNHGYWKLEGSKGFVSADCTFSEDSTPRGCPSTGEKGNFASLGSRLVNNTGCLFSTAKNRALEVRPLYPSGSFT